MLKKNKRRIYKERYKIKYQENKKINKTKKNAKEKMK